MVKNLAANVNEPTQKPCRRINHKIVTAVGLREFFFIFVTYLSTFIPAQQALSKGGGGN